MKSTYTILWLDDETDYLDSIDTDNLKSTIRSWGFLPEIKLLEKPSKFMRYAPFQNIDLIVIDYNLDAYGKYGQAFIQKVRDHDVYTEVIFYSSQPSSDLWNIVKEGKLEGIFISDRQNVIAKIEKVGRQSVRKVLDLDNMRGIVMAEVGEIDHIMDSVIRLGIRDLTGDDKQKVYDEFHDQVKSQLKTNCKDMEAFHKRPSIRRMLSLCDSYKRWRLLRSIIKLSSKMDNKAFRKYGEDILKPRNLLAHGKPKKKGKDGYAFSNNGESYLYNEKKSLSLRKLIHDYKKKLSGLEEELKAK